MRTLGRLCHLTVGFGVLCSAPLLHAQSACEVQKLIGSEVTQADVFGDRIAVSGDTMVIGARRDDDNGTNSGAVYVYRLDHATGDWLESQKLVAADGQPFDLFGFGLAICGDTLVVGSPYDDHEDCTNPPSCDSGSAYVFRRDDKTSQWTQRQKLIPNDIALTDHFGARLAMGADFILIGAPSDDDNGTDSGSTYAFRYDGRQWFQEQKLLPEDGAAGDEFGLDVAVDGDTAVIGAWLDDDRGVNAGAAYVFEYDGKNWTERQKLLASDGTSLDYLGRALAIDGDVILMGVETDDPQGSDSGSAYVFRYDGQLWVEEQKLIPSDGAEFLAFGDSVGLSGDIAVIGSSLDDDNGASAGSAYVCRFDGTVWVESEKLLASDGHEAHFFGGAIAVAGDAAIVGAVGDDDQGIQSGAAYVFLGLSGVDCNTNELSDACEIFGGLTPDFNGNGIPDACECPWDCGDGDAVVGKGDLLAMLAAWGTTGASCDFDGGGIGITDLLTLLANWGPCP